MNESERKEFFTQLLEKTEIYEEEQPNGQWLKSIEFKLPIISQDMKISLDNDSLFEELVIKISSMNGMDCAYPCGRVELIKSRGIYT